MSITHTPCLFRGARCEFNLENLWKLRQQCVRLMHRADDLLVQSSVTSITEDVGPFWQHVKLV